MAETTTVRETERKYSGEPVDADLASALARAAAEAMHRCAGPPREPAELALSAVYFDTEDLRLARAGITLRRRSGGTDDGWHLKLPAGSDARDEVRLPPDELGAPPAAVGGADPCHASWGAVGAGGRARHRASGVGAGRQRRPSPATVTDDRVTGQTLAAPTMVTRWAEIEVELAEHSTVEVLDRIEQALLDAGAQRAESWSKLGRMLADGCRRRPARGGQGRRSRGRGAGLRRGAGRRDPGDGPSRAPERSRFRARHAGGMPSDAKHHAVVSRGAGARPHRSPR